MDGTTAAAAVVVEDVAGEARRPRRQQPM